MKNDGKSFLKVADPGKRNAGLALHFENRYDNIKCNFVEFLLKGGTLCVNF